MFIVSFVILFVAVSEMTYTVSSGTLNSVVKVRGLRGLIPLLPFEPPAIV